MLDKGTMGDAVTVKCAVSGRSPQNQLKIVLEGRQGFVKGLMKV